MTGTSDTAASRPQWRHKTVNEENNSAEDAAANVYLSAGTASGVLAGNDTFVNIKAVHDSHGEDFLWRGEDTGGIGADEIGEFIGFLDGDTIANFSIEDSIFTFGAEFNQVAANAEFVGNELRLGRTRSCRLKTRATFLPQPFATNNAKIRRTSAEGKSRPEVNFQVASWST